MRICSHRKTPFWENEDGVVARPFIILFIINVEKGHGLTTLGSIKFKINTVWSTRWCPHFSLIAFALIWYGDSAGWTKAAWNTHNVVEWKHSKGHAYSSSTQSVITNFHSIIRFPNSTIRLYDLRKAVSFVWKADAKRIAEDAGSNNVFPDAWRHMPDFNVCSLFMDFQAKRMLDHGSVEFHPIRSETRSFWE